MANLFKASLILTGLVIALLGCSPANEPSLRRSPSATPSSLLSATISAEPTMSLLPEPSADGESGGLPALLIPTAPTGPELDGDPITARHADGPFVLMVTVQQEQYRAGQLIEVGAVLSYEGEQEEAILRGSSHSLVGFSLEGGEPFARIDPAFTSDCASHSISPTEPLVFDFVKSGGFVPGDPDDAFAEAYFADPQLRLPAGTWTIGAGTSFYTGDDCGDELRTLQASVTIEVLP